MSQSLGQESQLPNDIQRGTKPGLAAGVPGVAGLLSYCSAAIHTFVTIYPWPFFFMSERFQVVQREYKANLWKKHQKCRSMRTQMAFLPKSDMTRRVLADAKTLVPLAALYAVLLCVSWHPNSLQLLLPGSWDAGITALKAGKVAPQFVPTISTVGKLLSDPLAALSAWVHLQFISFFCARWIWMNGLANSVATAHSIILTALLPPLGFLSHVITCFLSKGGSDTPSAAATAGSGPGSAVSGFSSNGALSPAPGSISGIAENGAAIDGDEGPSSNGNRRVAHEVVESEGSIIRANRGQTLEEKVCSLGRINPNGGWRPWASNNPLPDWLTVEEPIYVNPSRHR